MNTTYYENEERQMSRSEKIQLAKSAFAQEGSGRNTRYVGSGYSRNETVGNSYGGVEIISARKGITASSEEHSDLKEGRHHFGMLRMVIAGVLFFVLVLSFHFELSYQGYDKAYVEQVLSDDSHWESLVNQVAQVMKQNVQKIE